MAKYKSSLAFVILGLSTLAQILVLSRSYWIPWAQQVWTLRSLPAWARAAEMLDTGQADFYEYLSFVRQNVPEDAKVYLPPHASGTPYAHIGLMQYFLFPREIDNCGANEVEACVRRASAPRAYFLAFKFFPTPEVAAEENVFIQYRGRQGIYAPR